MSSPLIERYENEKNGVKFVSFRYLKPVDAITCIGGKRIVINGLFNISIMKGSYKFGEQLQFKLFAAKDFGVSEELRNDSSWNVSEIDLPLDVGREMLSLALEECEQK